MRHHSEDLSAAANDRLAALHRQSFEQLRELPGSTSEPHPVPGKRAVISVWHDILRSGEHRIVVQAYQHGLMGIGRMFANGFAIDQRGQKRALSSEELAPFT